VNLATTKKKGIQYQWRK